MVRSTRLVDRRTWLDRLVSQRSSGQTDGQTEVHPDGQTDVLRSQRSHGHSDMAKSTRLVILIKHMYNVWRFQRSYGQTIRTDRRTDGHG